MQGIFLHKTGWLLPLALMSACVSPNRSGRSSPEALAAAEPETVPAPPMTPIWYSPEGAAHGRREKPVSEELDDTPTGRVLPELNPDRPRLNQRSPIGVNLEPPTVKSRDWVFVDAFKMSTPWAARARSREDAGTLDLDEQGWVRSLLPTQAAFTRVPSLAGGPSVVLYDGRGTLSVEGERRIDNDAPGRLQFVADPYKTLTLVITNTNPADYIRNIRVVPLVYEQTYLTQAFHPLFLRRLGKFSVLRFTGWGQVDESTVTTWAQRTRPEQATQALPSGVAYEYMIALANEIRADIWISIPHQADDDYVRKLAALLRENLEPELRVYVEYSNELWRGAHERSQAAYARRQGQFAGLDADAVVAKLEYQSQRSLEIFDIFEKELGTLKRMVRVIASRAGAIREHEILLSHDRAHEKTDVMAIAPFFGDELGDPTYEDRIKQNGVDWLLERLEQESLPNAFSQIRASQKMAEKYKVGMVAYSGGQFLVGQGGAKNDSLLNARFDEANRHPRMKSLYLALLGAWAKHGGELFMHASFVDSYGPSGRFGALEYLDQDASPKLDALLSFIDNRPRWWDDGQRSSRAELAKASQAGSLGLADQQPPPAPPGGYIGRNLGAEVEVPTGPMRTAVWSAGGTGVAMTLATAVFGGLYQSAASRRDRFIATNFSPEDGRPGRSLDDQAYRWSIAAVTSGILAGSSLATAGVLSMFDDPVSENAADPGVWISGSTGVIGIVAGGIFLAAHLNSAARRDQRLAENPDPSSSVLPRTLDNEAFRWSVMSAGAFTAGLAGVSLALYFRFKPKPLRFDEFGYPIVEGAGARVSVLPTGISVTW